MKAARYALAYTLLFALAGLPGCRLGLFDAVKKEVEEYKLEQAGSPGITVLKGINEVPEGTEMPIGPGVAGEHKLITFSIENPGTASLQLTGSPRVQIGGTHAAQFSINTLPASVIPPGGKSDFTIDFYPIGLPGERTATLLIENNASGDGSFGFTIVGEGVGNAGPEIQVTFDSMVIDEVPGYTHDFGKRLSGYTADATFTIYNIGTPGSTLDLSGVPRVAISGADAAMFSVLVQPDKRYLLEGNPTEDHTSFQIRYQPTAMGTHTATVSITNDDANDDETPYTFALTGTCYRLDVLFLVGVNGAMTPVMPSAKAGIAETMAALSSLDPNAAFALATTCDFPFSAYGWGYPGDEAYELLQGLTTTQASILVPLNALVQQFGADAPASQLEALYQATTGDGLSISDPIIYDIPASTPGWRTNALHVIVLITDFPFHNPEVAPDYPDYPGHTFAQTIAAMNAAAVEMVGLNVGYQQAGPDLQTIANATGGVFFSYNNYMTEMVMAGIDALMSQY